jgi:hypothetical protein
MWFRLAEHNTLSPQEMLYCYVSVALFMAELNLRKVEVVGFGVCPILL